jgi:NAD(P)-dependent dehydrogenase (short-subunit alcohol dehydrogenase family)
MAGKVIAVTGASRGIGAAIAQELAGRGFTVGCLSRKGAGVESTAVPAPLAKRLLHIACDVNDEASIGKAFAALAAQAGTISGLVNNAGVHLHGKSAELATARYEEVMDTNARSVFLCSREAYPYLARAGGTIVNIGSFFDKLGVKQNLAYCASKAAVGAITRCLAVEWAPKKIRVLDVAPGYIETELNAEAMQKGALRTFLEARVPTGGPGSVADVARMVAALFAEDIPYLTGATIYLDGGQGMAH